MWSKVSSYFVNKNSEEFDKAWQQLVKTIQNNWRGSVKRKTVVLFVIICLGAIFWPLVLIFLSYSLTRIFKSPAIREVLIIFLWIITIPFTIAWGSGLYEAFTGSKSTSKQEVKRINSPSPQPSSSEPPFSTSSPQSSPTLAPTPTPKPKPVSFDPDLGNNYVAANFAKDFFGTANKAAPGYIKSVRVDLTPEDLGGKSEEDYKKNLISVYLTVKVDSYLWNTTGESGQKDLAASFLNAISNSFGGIRHVIITNGARTVATAEWPLFGGEPKITLK